MNDIVLPRVTIHVGDCLESLRAMEAGSVHCCVTSPPYWGLRDYGTAEWEGGNPECPHRVPATGSTSNKGNNNSEGKPFSGQCRLCGARRVDRQIGLEQTPAEYVAKMVEVFREVRRVLRQDGTLWLNLGDSYNAHPGQRKTTDAAGEKQMTVRGATAAPSRCVDGLKPKDLVGIPWRVAFALQADGWWLRQDIVWSKPNPMPESVTDRCTKAHEYIFLLAKSERYHFDSVAIAEKAADDWRATDMLSKSVGKNDLMAASNPDLYRTRGRGSHHSDAIRDTRNKRSVWTVTTHPYPEAHFATYPPRLIEPCILAGCPADGTVLDPFGGSGTTAAVAVKHGRSAVLCELNPAYAQLAERRVREQLDGVGLFVGE